jgi:hypothetical protein
MPKNFSQVIAMMDERLWFRMTVCFLPGLILLKLVGYGSERSFLNMVSAAVLVIGVLLYAFWGRIRGFTALGEQDTATAEDVVSDGDTSVERTYPDVSGREQLDMLAELRALCKEEARESDRLIATEIAVNPQLSFSDATRGAVARRRILGNQ